MDQTKTLYFVRHAKSSWDNDSLADIDRPIKERGIRDAYDVAGRVIEKGMIPQLILSSPAIRALHTAVIFARVLEVDEERIHILRDLFLADTAEIINIIGKTPDNIESLMIFGHNPGFTNSVNTLSNLSLSNLPTSGFVKLVFKLDSWKKIGKNFLVEEYFDFPSNA